MKWLRLVILLSFYPGSQISAQQLSEKDFTLFTTAQGLSHNTITSILQDSTGYIWVAGASGLNRYDGNRFIQFHSNRDSSSLPAEDIWWMSWINKDQLAVYTSGLHVVNTRTGERRNLFIPYHDRQYQSKFNVMIGIVRGDDQGNIFIINRSGFYHYDKNFDLKFRFDYFSDAQVPVAHFYFGKDILQLDEKRMLVFSDAGLFIYYKEERKLEKMKAGDCPIMAEFMDFPRVNYQIFQLKPGQFFLLKSDTDSLVYVNTNTNKKVVSRLPINPIKNEFRWRSRLTAVNDSIFYITSHFSGFYKMRLYPETGEVKLYPEKYFPSHLCSSVLVDKENRFWVGTTRGLFRQDLQKNSVEIAYLPPSMADSFPNIRLGDVFVTKDKIWVGARGDGGLLLFDKKEFQFKKQIIYDKVDLFGIQINAITTFGPSTLLLGTNGPLYLFDEITMKARTLTPPQWKTGWWANDVFTDSRGNTWISSMRLIHYNSTTKEYTTKPIPPPLLSVTFGFEEDKDGNVWMASPGITRYNQALDRFDIVIDSFPFIKMPDRQVNSFVFEGQNKLWFNSNNNGLLCYDISKKSFRHFTTSDGLPDNNITSLMILGNKLWIASFSGLACMDLLTSQIISFGKEDGFPDMPIYRGARFFYDSSTQKLYISFADALTRFNPAEMLRRKSPPKLFIESMVINGEKNIFLPGEKITNSWREDQLMITIGSINFSNGQNQAYAYRVVQGNSNVPWQNLGSQPAFSISNLSPGEYRIQVKSFSTNNRWPEQVKEITVVVLPPFWKKDWFIISVSSLLLFCLYLFITWRTGRARKKEMEKTHVEKIKADHYKNQFELEQISNYFSSSLLDKKTEEEVLWDVTNNLIGRMNYEDCIIYLWNEDKTKMIQKAAYGPKGKPEIISEQHFDVLPGQGIVGQVMQSLQPILVNDTRLDHRYRVDDQFRLSEVCVPIIHNDELMGILDSEHHLPNYFSERDIKILTTIATLIGNKLKQIESEQSLDAQRKELATINEQLVEARLAALQAQMNPHFVFNALNSIKRMILDGDNEKASRYLSKFALMIRMTLNHSKEIFVTLDENVEYLKTYLEMEQLRFDDSFAYSIFTDENIEAAETLIPSMMIQPLVENAIWHGLLPAENDKKITISFTQHDNKIVCKVEDNGIGFRESTSLKKKNNNNSVHHSMGLENLQKRVRIMNEKYDMDCSLKIIDLKETGNGANGTRVILQFNLINA